MKRITIFYRHHEVICTRSWVGDLKTVRSWFEGISPPEFEYVGAIYTEAFDSYVKQFVKPAA